MACTDHYSQVAVKLVLYSSNCVTRLILYLTCTLYVFFCFLFFGFLKAACNVVHEKHPT